MVEATCQIYVFLKHVFEEDIKEIYVYQNWSVLTYFPKFTLDLLGIFQNMIKNLESPILIFHQESVLFTMECLLFTMEGLQFRKTCVRNQRTNQSKHS